MITNKRGFQSIIKLKIIVLSSILSINCLCAQNDTNSKKLNDSINFFELFNQNKLSVFQDDKIETIASIYFKP